MLRSKIESFLPDNIQHTLPYKNMQHFTTKGIPTHTNLPSGPDGPMPLADGILKDGNRSYPDPRKGIARRVCSRSLLQCSVSKG
jgi:hypothetical protein|mmetsp:Transcript_109647/g.186441  ORF Transcript_109647/g.186441 Transcript_109647/m.186441 type:complete len:84 (+) Transcript_109647:710-961(+)